MKLKYAHINISEPAQNTWLQPGANNHDYAFGINTDPILWGLRT